MLPLSTISKTYCVPLPDVRVIKSVLLIHEGLQDLTELSILCGRSLQRSLTANDYFLLGYLIGSNLVTDEYEEILNNITDLCQRQN